MFNKGLVSVRRQSNFPLITRFPLHDFVVFAGNTHLWSFQCKLSNWQHVDRSYGSSASSDFDIFNLLIQMTLNCHSFVKKMNTENNSCKIFGLRVHDEHYELECDQFTGRSTKTYKGGLKDFELKNKKIPHYCQEGKTFSVLLLHIIKKGALAHLLKEQKTFENIHIYCNYVYPLPISRADIHVLLFPHLSVRHRDKCCEHSFISTFTTCTLYPRHLISTI